MGISVDPVKRSEELASELEIPFPLLSDADLSTALAYGVAMEGEDIALPSVFLVGEDGTIRWRRIGEAVFDRPAVDVILEQVDRVQ